MTEADVEVAYTNKHYYVTILDEPIIDPKGELPPMSYGMYNRTSAIMEAYSTFLPAAIQTVIGLSAKMEELMPTEENVIQMPLSEIVLP